MNRKQKKFIFSREYHKSFKKGDRPPYHLSWGEYIKDSLVKKGYLVKDLREIETITVHCQLAKANVPLKEREQLQKKIV